MRDPETADTVRGRTGTNNLYFRLLVSVNRWVVTGAIALLVFLAFMTFGILKPVSLNQGMQTGNMVQKLFASMIGAIITGTSLVVTINQLVLSQEIGSFGSQQEKLNSALDIRQSTDTLIGETSPVDPARYATAIIEVTERRAVRLRDSVSKTDDEELVEWVQAYVADMLANTDHVRSELEDAEFGSYDVVAPVLDFDFDRKLHDIRRAEDVFADELTDTQRTAVTELTEAITMYGVVRGFLKDLYIQWSLMELSRGILYAAVVAFTIAGGMAVFIDPMTFTGTFLGIEHTLWVVSLAFSISTLPFVLFMAYILRLGTIAKLTLSTGPMVIR